MRNINDRVLRRLRRGRRQNQEQDEVHIPLVAKLRAANLDFCHIPNGLRLARSQANLLHLLGIDTGAADIVIWTPPPAVPTAPHAALELKWGRNRPTPEQEQWLARRAAQGWAVGWVSGLDAAMACLIAWGYQIDT